MRENEKLEEARYFLYAMSKLQYEIASSEIFRFNLSAFLCAARSIPQYALVDAQAKTSGQLWYDNIVTQSKVIMFFKDKRDLNIHREPVQVRQDIKAQFSDAMQPRDSWSLALGDSGGHVIETKNGKSDDVDPAIFQSPNLTVSYKFDDWPGVEDVMGLCTLYIQELASLIEDGKAKGFLS